LTLDLRAIAIIGLAALLYAAVIPPRLRSWALLIGSVIAIYWLQTFLFIRYADFLLPTLTLGLIVITWVLIRQPNTPESSLQENWRTLLLIAGLVIALSLFRFLPADYRLTPSRPPDPLFVIGILLIFAVLTAAVSNLQSLSLQSPVSQSLNLYPSNCYSIRHPQVSSFGNGRQPPLAHPRCPRCHPRCTH